MFWSKNGESMKITWYGQRGFTKGEGERVATLLPSERIEMTKSIFFIFFCSLLREKEEREREREVR